MISLDKKILDKDSSVAQRMISYGSVDSLYIIVPSLVDKFVELSPEVKVWGVGGNKIKQFFGLIKKGKKLIGDHVIDLITTQDPFFSGLIGVILKTKTQGELQSKREHPGVQGELRSKREYPGAKIKLEIQMHGDFFGRDYYKTSGLKNLISYYICNWFVLRSADRIRVVGQRIKESLVDIGIDSDKIEIIPIKIDSEYIKNYQPKFDLHNQYQNKKLFLFLGRLEPVKNLFFLMEVFAEVIKDKKDFVLLIVGSGSQKEKLKEKVSLLGIKDNIKFEEWTDDAISYLKTVDCVLFPSLSEGYGLVPMEASVAGTKVIMNDVGVANYELPKSDHVIILPVDDKDAWIKAVLNICSPKFL